MKISNPFITHICLLTHDVADLEWYKGAGYYGCADKTWHGPYRDIEEAKREFGNVLVHSPARGSRSRS